MRSPLSFTSFASLASLAPLISLALTLLSSSAWAHVTLEQPQVETGSTYKATLRVGHGCEGLPTTTLRVQLPAGFQGGKPMPKPGWTISTTTEKLATPYDNHGKTVTEDVAEITWTAKATEFALKDNEYDEFVVRGRAAMPVGAAWFKITQLCKDGAREGSNLWREIPAQGSNTRNLKFPAALLNVTAAPNNASAGSSQQPQPAHGTGHKH
jgi:periplasmic copper chaperone A